MAFSVNPNETVYAYPVGLPPPEDIFDLGLGGTEAVFAFETPVAAWANLQNGRFAHDAMAFYHPSLASYDGNATGPFSRRAAPQHQTSENIGHAYVHAFFESLHVTFGPAYSWPYRANLAQLGVNTTIMSFEEALAEFEAGSDHPKIIGVLISYRILETVRKDGWNHDGLFKYEGRDCTHNCHAFADYTRAYAPKNTPFQLKYRKRWQPLNESDGIGFFYTQKHVTSHLSELGKVRPVGLSPEQFGNLSLDDPMYDLDSEVDRVLDRVAQLDDRTRLTIELFDKKIVVNGFLYEAMRQKYNLSFEAQSLMNFAMSVAEHDSVVVSWREKLRHDLVRPTSLVHELGDQKVISVDGEEIRARDWVPFQRVMPHSEFPSGSGCICTALTDVIRLFVKEYSMGQDTDLEVAVFYPAGSSRTNPGTFPKNDTWLSYATLEEVRTTCGQSRLDGGMHFDASVPASYELCKDIGRAAVDYVKSRLGGASLQEFLF